MTDSFSQSGLLLAPAGDPSGAASRLASRKKASTACSACRARRSKCTGGVPCLSCVSHRTDCIKDENEDGRRRVAIKRKLEGLETDRNTLDNLVAILKYGDQSKIQSLTNLVRTNASHQELRDFLDNTLRDPEYRMRYSADQQQGNDGTNVHLQSRGQRRTGAISDLINPPLQVPAQPWTQVTKDADFVSHLISLWFTWIHPCYRWVEEQEFIEAMQSQDINSPVCTPYLVNYILAEACLLDMSDTRKSSEHHQLRDRFLAEAKAGMDAEQGKVSLTMIQAMGVQWTYLYLNGQDRLGRLVLNTQNFLVKGLGKWRAQLMDSPQSSPSALNHVDRSIRNVCWTIHALSAFNLAENRDSGEFREPGNTVSGHSHESAPGNAWSSYPLHRNVEFEFHSDCHFRALISLAHKMTKNEAISKERERGSYQEDQLQQLVRALHDWPNSLPSCMRLHVQAMPHVLVLHALHRWIFLVLAKQAAAAQAGQASEPIITSTPASPEGFHWQRMSLTNAVAIAGIIDSYRQNWGTDYCPPMMLPPVSLSLLTLLEDLDNEEHHQAFLTLGRFLRAVARKFRVARGVVQVVKNAIKESNPTLPPEMEHVFDAHEPRTLDTEASSEGSRSDFASPERDMTMNYLLEKWEDLNLDVKDYE